MILLKYLKYILLAYLLSCISLYAESSSIRLPDKTIYLGGAISSYDNTTLFFEIGYEVNDTWDIQVEVPLNTNFAFIDAIYKYESNHSGVYFIGGFKLAGDVTLKPGLGYSFILQNNVILKTEINSQIHMNDFEENIAANLQLIFYI